MRLVLPIFVIFLEFLGQSLLQALESEKFVKQSSFKDKLKRDELVLESKEIQSKIDTFTTTQVKQLEEIHAAAKPTTTTIPPNESQLPTDIFGREIPKEPENETMKEDYHTYYNSTTYADPKDAKRFWIDLDKMPDEHVFTHDMLSNSHRQAATVQLSFSFPFYGSMLRNVTIATGGFLYTGDHLHNWIAATQYVAPLMANFDTSVHKDSVIRYADNGSLFVAEWDNVFLRNNMDDGQFTFQVSLFKNGDICFAYKQMPYAVAQIFDESHPVKVGISDAYVLERAVYFVKRKTIYEYHRVDMLKAIMINNSAIYFKALETCLSFKDCQTCIAHYDSLMCGWCDAVQRCSDGIDRLRQSWVSNACLIRGDAVCNVPSSTEKPTSPAKPLTPKSKSTRVKSVTTPSTSVSSGISNEIPIAEKRQFNGQSLEATEQYLNKIETTNGSSITIGAVVTILIFIAMLCGIGVWIFYAYRFPQTPSGQFLIKYRPSQWTMKRDEANVSNTDSFHM